jgi:hypothetical protein
MDSIGIGIIGSKRFLLKRKAYSYAAYAAAQNFSTIGAELPALLRILRSLVLWPFPYSRREVSTTLARPKKFVITCLRLLGIVAKAAPKMSAGTPGLTHPIPLRQVVHEGSEFLERSGL